MNYVERSSGKANSSSASQEIPRMKPKASLPWSQQPDTCPHPKPA